MEKIRKEGLKRKCFHVPRGKLLKKQECELNVPRVFKHNSNIVRQKLISAPILSKLLASMNTPPGYRREKNNCRYLFRLLMYHLLLFIITIYYNYEE